MESDANTAQLRERPSITPPKVKMLINGQFVDSETSHWADIPNPATQEVLAKVPFSTPDEIETAVAAAKEAFVIWKNTAIPTRARLFFSLPGADSPKLGSVGGFRYGRTRQNGTGCRGGCVSRA